MVNYIGLYPGLGSQQPQMGLDLYKESEKVRSLFTLASDISHANLYTLLKNGTIEDLTETAIAQLVITAVNRSASIILSERGYSPLAVAGFSLGELSAYREAEVISDESLFTLVTKRGQLMAQNGDSIKEKHGDLAMAAIIGLPFETVDKVIKESGIQSVWAANDNSVQQVVISGIRSKVEQIESLLKSLGTRRIIYLKVSGPFHTPLMNESKEEFASFIDGIPFFDPIIPLYSNVTGERMNDSDMIKKLCAQQIVSPVRWTKIIDTIEGTFDGVDALEVGYGKVLTNLCKGRSLRCRQAGSLCEIDQLDEEIGYERVL
jgi:[acyl-carrier-protein] S-malonyltransferase